MSEEINSRTERRKSQQPKRKNKGNNKPRNAKSIIKKIFLIAILAGFFVLIGGAGLFAYYASSAPKLDEALLKDPLSSSLADINGEIFYKSGTEKREFVAYADIPDFVKEAVLATEDVRFYKHHGMDFYRLGGAIIANIKGGFGSQGASTLTQQVIKNSFLSPDKTLKRKAQEAWLAFQLERAYDKDEIFEMYFNKILMSGNIHGIGTASQHFYGKELNELELPEVAMLAGLPQSPNGYNPNKNPERAEKRRNIVLKLMHQHKKITQAEMEAAQAIPVTATLIPPEERQASDNTKYAAFVDVVRDELEARGMLDVLAEGVIIQTTLDPSAQLTVESALASDIYKDDEIQGALTVLDTKTGAIVAVGGGRNYQTGFLNFATDEKRQPGSAIKPILDYGPAIEYLNWSTGQTVIDDPYNYKGTKDTAVRNVDRKYQGNITMREALSRSRNVPAVKTYEEVGRDKAINFASSLGIAFTNDYPSNAIGGSDDEFSTLQMAGAYAAFGNNGVYTAPHAIKKITYRDKTELNLTPESVIAMKDSTAYMITDVLRDVMKQGGTGTRAQVAGLDIAGKTGTTNDAVDSWFAGYTTNYTIAAWGGYQKRHSMEKFEGERYIPQDLFREVMSTLSAKKETARFSQPSSVIEGTIEYGSNPFALASATTPQHLRRTELFVKGSIPEKAAPIVVELEAPTNLTADFDIDSDSVILNWAHNAPDPNSIEGDVEFIISTNIDGGETKEMTRTNDLTVTFSGVEPNQTYTFSVIAKIGDLVSSPATVTLLIEEEIEEPEEEEEEIIEDIEEEEDIETPPIDENNDNNNDNSNQNNQNQNNSNQNNQNQNNQNPNQNNQNQNNQNQNNPNQNNQNQNNQNPNQNPPGVPEQDNQNNESP